jgi:uncharacterized repeat protein (TIGR01451 family)
MLDKILAVILVLAVSTSLGFAGVQETTSQPQPQLRIFVRNGQNAQNDARKREEVVLAVHVEDAAGNAAAGARVEFTAPLAGASGVFASGARTVSVTADESGDASVRGFRPNSVAGAFEIQVRAVYQGTDATAVIRQSNVATSSSTRKWLPILGGAGGGVAALAALAGGGGDDSSNTPTGPRLTVSAGSNSPNLIRNATANFTVTVGNSGSAPTSGTVTVSDTFPTGLAPAAANGTGWTCNISGQAVTCTRGDALNAGASYPPITVSVLVAGNAPASLTNTATATGGGSAPASGSVTVGTGGGPELTLAKTASAQTFSRGGTGSFNLTVTNGGGSATNGTQITVTDSLPPGMTPVSTTAAGWVCNTSGTTVTCNRSDVLNPSESFTPITITVRLDTNAASSITNSASVSGGGDSTPSTGAATVGTVTGPDLNMSKTASSPILPRGGSGSFTLTVINNGGSPTNGSAVTVTDTLPDGFTTSNTPSGTGWSCTPGQTVTCTRSDVLSANTSYPAISVPVSIGSNVPGTVTNSASVVGGGDTTPATGSVMVGTQSGPNLTLSKTASSSIFQRGAGGGFTLTVTNSGDTATSGTVTVSDSVPSGLRPAAASGSGWSCPISGQTVSCTRSDALAANASYPAISISVEVATEAGSTITNMATVSGGGDTTPGSGSVSVSIVSGPDLAIVKTATVSTLRRGAQGSFTLAVTNIGDSATNGTSVTVTDSLPAGLAASAASGSGWSCSLGGTVSCSRSDGLPPGSAYPTISLSVNVAADAPASITNTASVSGGGDSTAGTGSATINTIAGPDLTISKSSSAPMLVRGGTGSFTMTVGNRGDAPTSGTVTLSDPLPAGLSPTGASGSGWNCSVSGQTATCTREDALQPNASYPTVSVNVSVASDAAGSLTNTASISGGGDNTPGSGSASVTTLQGPDLTLSKTASAPAFRRGKTGSFNLTVRNSGDSPTDGSAVTVSDAVPGGLTPTAASGSGWSCNVSGQNVSCSRSNALDAAASYPAITVSVNVAADAPGSITNSASVSGGGDGTPGSGSVTVATAAGPNLTLSKTASAQSFPRGGTGSFTLTAGNAGDSPTSGTVTVSDPMPDGLSPTSAAGTGWTCNIGGQNVSCTRGDALNANDSYPGIEIKVNVANSAPASITNTASASGGDDDSPASASQTVATANAPVLEITKTAGSSTFVKRGIGTFTLAVTNTGTAGTNGQVTVTDPLPDGLRPTITTGLGWSCNIVDQDMTCTRTSALTPGQSYPAILITVAVASNASGPLTNTATVSGGGDSTPSQGSATVNIANNISITKETDQPVVGPGDTVAFSLAVDNPDQIPLADTMLIDTLPQGFAYQTGSARIRLLGGQGETAAQEITPELTADGLRFSVTGLPAAARYAITYLALVTSKARPGELQSRAAGIANLISGGRLDAIPGMVRLVVRPSAFTLTQVLIGRVFEDLNQNSTFDKGEPGVANVRVVSSSGQSVTTDSAGQYNLPALAPGAAVVAVDPATIPAGWSLPPDRQRNSAPGALLHSPLGSGSMLRQNFPLVRTPTTRRSGEPVREAGRRSPLVVAVGEVGIGLSRPGADATAGASRIDGEISVFYQTAPTARDLLTVAVRSKDSVNDASGNTGLFELDPRQRLYPVPGDTSTRQQLAQSASRLYARYDRGGSYVMYGDLQGDTAGASGLLDYTRNVTGMRFRLGGGTGAQWFEGQLAQPRTAYMRDILTPTAGPAIRLSRTQLLPGSETIMLEVRDRRNPERVISRQTLIRNVDYTIDPASGVLFMTRSLGLFDSSLNLVQLVSSYEYETAGVDSTMYLGRGSYAIPKTGLRLGFSALTQNQGGMNFALGGFELERKLPNGGHFKLAVPMSSGYVMAGPDPLAGPSAAAACCDEGRSHNGKAVRAEFEQPLAVRETFIRGSMSTTDDGFYNPYGSITVQGQESREVSLETRGFAGGRLSVGAGQEVNRNNAVDNDRTTVSLKLSQSLRENLLAEVGIDRRNFSDHKAGKEIDSHLVSAGVKWNPMARLETSLVREQNLAEADPTYPSQTLLGAQLKLGDSKLFATQRFSSAPIIPIGGAELSGVLSPQSTQETAIGIETRLHDTTSMSSRYRVDSGPAGTDSFAVLGLLTRVPLRSGLSLDWSVDHALHLAGNGRGYVGGSVGFSQSVEDTRLTAVRYELRRRDTSEHILTAGIAGRLTASMSALARYRFTSEQPGTVGGSTGQLALALRPRQSDRVAMLFSYDYGALNAAAFTAGRDAAYNRRLNRLSADALLQVRRGLEFYTRVAPARTPAANGGTHQARYVQGRLQQSLFKRYDIAGEARWVQEAANISGNLVSAVEWGTWITRDLRVGLGYSPQGFNNPGALLNSTAARGGTYLVISSRLSAMFNLLGSAAKGN